MLFLNLFIVTRGMINFSTVDYFLNEINFKGSRVCKIQTARVFLSGVNYLV
jgi:hypothetical protein